MTGLPPVLSPTLFAARSSGLSAPDYLTENEGDPTICCRCGVQIERGDLFGPHTASGNFTDWMALADARSRVVCVGCATLSQAPHVKPLSARTNKGVVITEDGWYRAGKNVEIAYWLLHPPASGPWMWTIGTAKGQHLFWRARLNHCQALFFLQWGVQALAIRHAYLFDLIAETREWQRHQDRALPYLYEVEPPFKSPVRQRLLPEVVGTPLSRLILNARPGERWALAKLVYAGMKKGVMPDFPVPPRFPSPLFE